MLVTALSRVYQWFPLGIRLGLSFSTLKTIEQNQMKEVEMCRRNMLDTWLKGPVETRNKQILLSALQLLTPSITLITTRTIEGKH